MQNVNNTIYCKHCELPNGCPASVGVGEEGVEPGDDPQDVNLHPRTRDTSEKLTFLQSLQLMN